jgi:GT2 family glycosyltransferase
MSNSNPLFSIVVVHYQGVNTHEVFCSGMDSLKAQTFRDYEILAYHDGPLLDDSVKMPVSVVCSEKRYDDWGHSLRDRGIKEAKGEYIIHFNGDNILYPNALEEMAKEISREPRICDKQGRFLDTNDIVIFPVKMIGLQKFRDMTIQWKNNPNFYLILTGNPPVLQNIDCMQFVMKRELWIKEGGWYDKRKLGDGYMYQAFAQKYGYRTVGPVLGEHR